MWKKKESEQSPTPMLGTPAGMPKQKQLGSTGGLSAESVDLEELLGLKDQSGSSMSLIDIWHLIRERWLLGTIIGLVFGGIAAAIIMSQPKQYESFISFNLKGAVAITPGMFNPADGELDAHVAKATSQNFFGYLAENGIATHPELNTALGGTDKVAIINQLSRSVTASRAGDFIRVNVRFQDPEIAGKLANEIGISYRLYDEQEKAEELDNSEQSLQKDLNEAKGQLDKIHRDIFELNQTTQTADGFDPATNRLVILNGEIPALDAEVRKKAQTLENIRNTTDIQEKLAITEIASNQQVQKADKEYRDAVDKLAELEQTGLGANHPDLQSAVLKEKQERANLETEIRSATVGLESDLNLQDSQLSKMRAELEALSGQLENRGEHAGEFAKLETQRDNLKARMNDHQSNLDKIRVQKAAGLSNLGLIDKALPNYTPVTPDKRLAMLASLAIFSLSLVGLPVVLGLLDTRLKSIGEIEKFLGLDVLGTVPAKNEKEIEDLGLAVIRGTDEPVIESFRVLYSSIRMVSKNEYPQTMLVTSSAPSEGKSFITTNLGAFFADQGKRTLIIDCDFRRPSQHRNVKETNDQGVIRWYHSNEPVPEDPDQFGESKALGFLALGETENLYLLRAGGSTKSPTGMIESPRFAQLVHSLRAYFDVILFDTPPVGLFPDAVFIADYTDEALFVTKFRELNRHKQKFALSQLQKAGCNVLGIVVNYLTTRAATGYGYGYSDYGYGHYGSKDYARYYQSDSDSDSDSDSEKKKKKRKKKE
jgi:polysaccharide biosynthesis transport protein